MEIRLRAFQPSYVLLRQQRKNGTMAASSPDDYGHWSTPDEPYPSPAPDVSQDKVRPAPLPYELTGLSHWTDRELQSQSLEHFLSSVEDGMNNYRVPEHAARARRSVEEHLRVILSRPQVVDELGIIPELLEDPGDSPVSASEVIKDPNLVESSKAPRTSDLTANGFSRRTGSRYSNTFPHSSDQVSVTSLQTFETALSSIGSYTTAPSGPRVVSHVGQWTTSSTEEWIAGADTMPYRMLARSLEDKYLERLGRSMASSYDEPSAIVRATVKKEPLQLSTLVEGPTGSLVSRIELERDYSDAALDKGAIIKKPEQFIRDHAVKQEVVKKLLSAYETFDSQWLRLLKAHSLILDPKEALDWSGRGQHVEYSPEEQDSIPLVSKGNLGSGASGIVDRVRCRRIDLARKTIRCIRKPTREEAAKEIRHLQQLQHRHIVRLVGTYMLKKNLSILMYPATEYNLEEYLGLANDILTDVEISETQRSTWSRRLVKMIACLVNAVAFIHAQNTKHMDIKPTNILVQHSVGRKVAKVYITDFGIARSYQSREESFTDSPISYTRIYTAPEVIQQTTRGPPADIFSLGCVFMEILATLVAITGICHQEHFRQVREGGADNSYQANIEDVVRWYESRISLLRVFLPLVELNTFRESRSGSILRWMSLLPTMLAVSPEERPSAAELKEHTQHFACGSCDAGPEPFQAAT
jgi:hypothetical protein